MRETPPGIVKAPFASVIMKGKKVPSSTGSGFVRAKETGYAMFEKWKNRLDNWMHPKDDTPPDLLYRCIFGKLEPKDGAFAVSPDMDELAQICGTEVANRPVQVAIIRLVGTACTPSHLKLVLDACRQTSDSEEALLLTDNCSQVILVFFMDAIWEDQVRDMLENVRNTCLTEMPKENLCITVSNLVDNTENLLESWRNAYRTAVGLQDYRYVKPKGKIITYADIVHRRDIYPKGFQFRFDQLRAHIEEPDSVRLTEWLSGVYSFFAPNDLPALGLCIHLTLEIVVNAVSLFREKDLLAESYLQPPEMLVLEVLSQESPEHLYQWATRFLDTCRKALILPAEERVPVPDPVG